MAVEETQGEPGRREEDRLAAPSYGELVAGLQDPKVRDFAGRFTSFEEAARAGLEFRQKLSGAFQLPGATADEAERAAFRAKVLGVPETAAGYDLRQPEDLPEELQPLADGSHPLLDRWKARMHEIGAPPEVAQAAYDFLVEDIIKEGKASLAARDRGFAAEAAQELHTLWGADYEDNRRLAARTAARWGEGAGLAPDQLGALLEEARLDGQPLGSHPAFLRLFAAIGERMREPGGELLLGLDAAPAEGGEARMRDLTGQAYAAQERGDRDGARKLFQERDALAQQIGGGEPIVGAGARTL